MRERIQHVLQQIAQDPQREARWLNTVSLLEFIGARKISRTVADRHPTLEVLQHLADETRHALAFKRLAFEVAGGEVQGYLCPEAAGIYFQTLDRTLAGWAAKAVGAEDTQLSYLLTTTLIEQRAMQIYPLYKAASRNPVVREELGRVVVEEQGHRRSIEEICVEALGARAGKDLTEPKAVEAGLFEALLQALEAEVGAAAALVPPPVRAVQPLRER
jgi:hypothetical protein